MPWSVFLLLIAVGHIHVMGRSMKGFSVSNLLNTRRRGDGRHEEKSSISSMNPPPPPTVQELFFEQRLDHFATHPTCDPDTKDCEIIPLTFQQRFFYSNRFVSKKDRVNAVAFLCIGGEGPSLDASVLVDSVHCTGDMIELAEKLFKV